MAKTEIINRVMMNRVITVNIRMAPDELEKLDDAWMMHSEHMTRTQYIRAAINHYAGLDICQSDYTRKFKNDTNRQNLEKKKQDDRTNEFKRV